MCCSKIQKTFTADKKCFSNATSAEENRRQFLIELPKDSSINFCRVQVDDCLITSEKVEKCDYAFCRCSNQDFYFVELKGTDIQKAFNQIVATISHFKAKIKLEKSQIFGFIVASRVRPQQRQNARNLKKAFMNNHGNDLRIESTKLIFKP